MMFRFPSVICTRCTGFFCLAIIKGPPMIFYHRRTYYLLIYRKSFTHSCFMFLSEIDLVNWNTTIPSPKYFFDWIEFYIICTKLFLMKYCFYFLKTYKLKKYIALLLLSYFWKLQYNKRNWTAYSNRYCGILFIRFIWDKF